MDTIMAILGGLMLTSASLGVLLVWHKAENFEQLAERMF